MELKFDKKTLHRLLLCAIGVIAVYWILHDMDSVKLVLDSFKGILTPFIIGSVLAFILNVPMRAFENGLFKKIKQDKLRRCAALIATLICLGIVVTVVMLLLIPQLRITANNLGTSLPNQIMT